MKLNASKEYPIRFLKFKRWIHPQLVKVLPLMCHGPLQVDGALPEGACVIVANHLGIEDVPTLGQAIGRHACLLISDEDKNTLTGAALSLNGVQWVSRLSKTSRCFAEKQIVSLLQQGTSFCMYPEATWNLSPNQLMLPMNYGCLRIARKAGVPVVPVVSWFEGETRHAVIAEPYFPCEDLREAIEVLRSRMATLIFDYIAKPYRTGIPGVYRCESRAGLRPDFWDGHVAQLYSAYPRANADQAGCRSYESQFIFTPKTDDHRYFQEFHSLIRGDGKKRSIRRISSDAQGFREACGKDFFGWGYNETKLLTGAAPNEQPDMVDSPLPDPLAGSVCPLSS